MVGRGDKKFVLRREILKLDDKLLLTSEQVVQEAAGR